MKVRIAKFGILIGLIKTLEFEDEHSGTILRALKTLTLKKLVNTKPYKEKSKNCKKFGILIGLIKTLDDSDDEFYMKLLVNTITF